MGYIEATAAKLLALMGIGHLGTTGPPVQAKVGQ